MAIACDRTILNGIGAPYPVSSKKIALIGGASGDFLRGMAGIDTLSYASSGAGMVIFFGVNNIATASGGHATGDSGDGFENITGSAFDDFLFANAVANVLTGGDGDLR